MRRSLELRHPPSIGFEWLPALPPPQGGVWDRTQRGPRHTLRRSSRGRPRFPRPVIPKRGCRAREYPRGNGSGRRARGRPHARVPAGDQQVPAPSDRDAPDIHLLRVPDIEDLTALVEQARSERRGNRVTLRAPQIRQEPREVSEADGVSWRGHAIGVMAALDVGGRRCNAAQASGSGNLGNKLAHRFRDEPRNAARVQR